MRVVAAGSSGTAPCGAKVVAPPSRERTVIARSIAADNEAVKTGRVIANLLGKKAAAKRSRGRSPWRAGRCALGATRAQPSDPVDGAACSSGLGTCGLACQDGSRWFALSFPVLHRCTAKSGTGMGGGLSRNADVLIPAADIRCPLNTRSAESFARRPQRLVSGNLFRVVTVNGLFAREWSLGGRR